MPPLTCSEHLVSYLFDIGPTIAGNLLTHAEIGAWQENVGIDLEPWEVRVLRRLSSDYMSESRKAEKPDCPSPWADAPQIGWKSLQRSLKNLASL